MPDGRWSRSVVAAVAHLVQLRRFPSRKAPTLGPMLTTTLAHSICPATWCRKSRRAPRRCVFLPSESLLLSLTSLTHLTTYYVLTSQVRLQEISSGNATWGAWTKEIVSTASTGAILALRSSAETSQGGDATWHRSDTTWQPVTLGSWDWRNFCAHTSATGWPYMYHACGNGNVSITRALSSGQSDLHRYCMHRYCMHRYCMHR